MTTNETFKPSKSWFRNWPWQQSTIVRLAIICTPQDIGRLAIADFMASLSYQSDESACSGGYCIKPLHTENSAAFNAEIYSAGEDGFDSALYGVEDLTEFLRSKWPDVIFEFQELKPKKSLVP